MHDLLSLDRARNLCLGLQIKIDGTARVSWQGFPVIFVGVSDVDQRYHHVASALVKSENNIHMLKVLTDTFKAANRAMAALGKEELTLDYGNSDNCDALQNAIIAMGGKPVNCSVHMMMGTKKAPIEVEDPDSNPRQ